MFEIGWVEMMVVVVVMIVVIGPKDLPAVLHTMGRWIARVRAMAREFQDGIEELAREAGVDDVRKGVNSIRDFRIEEEIEKTIDPKGELRQGITGETEKAPAEDSDAENDAENDGGLEAGDKAERKGTLAGPAAADSAGGPDRKRKTAKDKP